MNLRGITDEKLRTGILEVLQEQFPHIVQSDGHITPDQMGKSFQAYLNFDWLADFDFTEREIQEIAFAHIYATFFGHGTSGHNQYLIIDKLTAIIKDFYQVAQESNAQ